MFSAGNMEGVSATAVGIGVSSAGGDNRCRGKNWTTQEQLALIDAYVNVGFDAAAGDQQRVEVFSSRIEREF
jgi:hypothetical protein